MKLLELSELVTRLEQHAKSLRDGAPGTNDDYFSAIVLRPSQVSSEDLRNLQKQGVQLPLDFLHLLQRVDLNSLLLNGVLFADGRNMVSFLETQLRHPESFWNKQDPSSSYVIIASSDSYVVAMSLADGTVWAWLRDEGPQGRKCVATTPELLLRGLGMLQVEQDITREELGDLVRAVGSNEGAGFWSDLFEGFR